MRGVLLAAVAGLVGCGGGSGKISDGGSPGSGGPTATRPAATAPPAVAVTAMDLYTAYRDGNPAAADAKYLGKTLRVSGTVLDIEQGPGDGYTVGFDTGPNVVASGVALKAAVAAPLPASERAAAAKMRFRDEVTVVGRCEGKRESSRRMGGILIPLADARVVSHTRGGKPVP